MATNPTAARNRVRKMIEIVSDFKEKPDEVQDAERSDLIDSLFTMLEECDALLMDLPEEERLDLIDRVIRSFQAIGLISGGLEAAQNIVETLIDVLK